MTCFYYHNHLFLRCPERDRLVAAWCFLKGDFCFLGQAGDTGINSWVNIHRWQDKPDMEMFSLKYQSRNGWWLISICSWNVVIHYNVFCLKENQILFKGEWEPVTEYIHMQIQLTLEQQGTRGTNDLHSWTSMYNLKKCTLSTLGFPTKELKVIKFCWGKSIVLLSVRGFGFYWNSFSFFSDYGLFFNLWTLGSQIFNRNKDKAYFLKYSEPYGTAECMEGILNQKTEIWFLGLV